MMNITDAEIEMPISNPVIRMVDVRDSHESRYTTDLNNVDSATTVTAVENIIW